MKYQPLAGRHEDPVATALRIAEEYSSVEHSQSFGDEGKELRRLARAYLAGSLERLRQLLMHRFQFPADNPLAAMYTCPVCGYPELTEPAYDFYNCSSFDIFSSCSTEFGLADFYVDRSMADVPITRRKPSLSGRAHAPTAPPPRACS